MTGEFTQIRNELIISEQLDVYEYRIISLLISYSNDGLSFPSYRTIAKLLRISQKKVVDSIQSLIEKGFLLKENRTTGKGKKTSNCYYISEQFVVTKKQLMKTMQKEFKKVELFSYDWLNDD